MLFMRIKGRPDRVKYKNAGEKHLIKADIDLMHEAVCLCQALGPRSFLLASVRCLARGLFSLPLSGVFHLTAILTSVS